MRQVKFYGGAGQASDVERLKLPEKAVFIAFSGRSNVGKSSLLNALLKTKLARVSKEPGKTREINFYGQGSVIFTDLPGYGYAKVGRKLRELWGREITAWLAREPRVAVACVLVDGRHGFMESDLECVKFLHSKQIPHVVVFTKMDKWKSANAAREAERELAEKAERLGLESGEFFFTSSERKEGVGELMAFFRTLIR